MAATPPPKRRTVEEVFNEFRGRRAGLMKALTVDFRQFYEQCDPEKDNLCLFGLPNETWEVKPPLEEAPPRLPEPALGINFGRKETPEEEWRSLVAVHSDSWLVSVAFFFAGRFGFDKNDRMKLFEMINVLPTLYEEVVPTSVLPVKKRRTTPHNNGITSKSQQPEPPASKEEVGKQVTWLCGACRGVYVDGDFWILCDVCEVWFHGKCVKVTPEEADYMDKFGCPNCRNSV